jgi:hypothetical protein
MIHIFLSQEDENKLGQIARARSLTKEQLAESILRNYLDGQFIKATPFELGRDLFGKFGSADGSLSTAGSRALKDKLSRKYRRQRDI